MAGYGIKRKAAWFVFKVTLVKISGIVVGQDFLLNLFFNRVLWIYYYFFSLFPFLFILFGILKLSCDQSYFRGHKFCDHNAYNVHFLILFAVPDIIPGYIIVTNDQPLLSTADMILRNIDYIYHTFITCHTK